MSFWPRLRPFSFASPCAALACAILLFTCSKADAGVGKGFQILLDRGFQLQSLSQDDCYLTLSTYSNANYTAINWNNAPGQHSSRPDWMGPAPGFLWARWAADETQMPPQITPYGGDETPFMPQFMAMQLGDEWDLTQASVRTRLVNWMNSVKTNYPNVILYHNNWGSQIDDADLDDYLSRALPDMLNFDTYPWQSVWDSSQPNHIGASIPGPPTGWYNDLRRNREHAKSFGIPLGIYRQCFHSVEDYDTRVYRDPSFSELRLNTFGALAFNVKYICDFLYNTSAGSLFTKTFNGSGDTTISTNGLYAEMADVNLRVQNLGKAMVHLAPIPTEAFPGYTTSILFLLGYNASGATNGFPIGFRSSTQDPRYTDWAYQRNDPYLTNNWTVVNKGTKNSGNAGDVIISWFKPMDEAFDGPTYSNEVYMMVVNGLTDPTGVASNCLQEITLNFAPSLTAIDVMNQYTGHAQTQSLPLVNGLRQLVLDLNGGDCVLFKFSDGAPFVGDIQSPLVTLAPVSQTNTLAATVNLTARGEGASPLSLQWRYNGTNIPGATNINYTISNLQPTNAGNYSFVISNSLGAATSSVATVTLIYPPQITTQPASQTLPSGSQATFTVVASASPAPSYQWRYNGTNIFGATGSSYSRQNVQSSDAGNYSVVVSNALGGLASSNAVLVVNGPPSFTLQPKNQGALISGSATFVGNAVGVGPLSYVWFKDGVIMPNQASPTLSINNVQSSSLATYTLSAANAYGVVYSVPATLAVASTPSIQTQPQSRTVNAGTMVVFNVGATGNGLAYQWQHAGTNVSDTLTNLVDGPNVFGSTSDTLVIGAATRFDAGRYSVIVSNVAGSTPSSTATLIVNFGLPLREDFNYTPNAVLSNCTAPNFMAWTDVGYSTPGPTVTNVSGNLTVPGLAAPTGNSVLFGGLGSSARLSWPVGVPVTSGTLYFSFAMNVQNLSGASSSGGFFAGFNNSRGAQANPPTVIAPRVYLRTNSFGYQLGIAKNTDTTSDWYWDTGNHTNGETVFIVASYTFGTSANTTDDVAKLWVNPDPSTFGAANPPAPTCTAVTGNDISASQIASFIFFQRSTTLQPAAVLADDLRIDSTWAGVTSPGTPAIAVQPVSVVTNSGRTVSFSIATTAPNPSYQWIRNGSALSNGGNISGATNSTLTVGNVGSTDAGNYEVVVTSAGSSIVSSLASLSLISAPAITTQPQSVTVPVGTSAGFSVAASGNMPFSYQWMLAGTNLSGSTTPGYTISSAQRYLAGNYSVMVTNSAGSVTSSNALLTMTPVSPVQISSPALVNGQFQLQGSGDPGSFIVQASSNLFNWFDVTNIFGGDGGFTFTDSQTNMPQRFYRLKLYP